MDNTEQFTCVEFCAGYGGIGLGLKRAIPTLRVIAACEIEAFAAANLVAKMEAGGRKIIDAETNPTETQQGLADAARSTS